MADKRLKKTQDAISAAMLELLEKKPLSQIAMSDIARSAGISRSTLYAHFGNVNDIFQFLVESFSSEVKGLHTQLKCSSCENRTGERLPFCTAVRAAGKYQPLVLAPEFLSNYLDYVFQGPFVNDALAPYLETGISEKQAKTLFTFQITGCYTAATASDNLMWEESQQAIDEFIRGGLNALRSMPHQ